MATFRRWSSVFSPGRVRQGVTLGRDCGRVCDRLPGAHDWGRRVTTRRAWTDTPDTAVAIAGRPDRAAGEDQEDARERDPAGEPQTTETPPARPGHRPARRRPAARRPALR